MKIIYLHRLVPGTDFSTLCGGVGTGPNGEPCLLRLPEGADFDEVRRCPKCEEVAR